MNRIQVTQGWSKVMTPEEFTRHTRSEVYGCQALYASGARKGEKCIRGTFPLCGTHHSVFLGERGTFTPAFTEYYEKVAEEMEAGESAERKESRFRVGRWEPALAESREISRARRVARDEQKEAQLAARREARSAERARREEQRAAERAASQAQLDAFLVEARRAQDLAERAAREERRAARLDAAFEEAQRAYLVPIPQVDPRDEVYSLLLTSFQSDTSRHLIREETKEECQVCTEPVGLIYTFPCCKTESSKFSVCVECLKKLRKRRFVKCPNCRKTCYKVPHPQAQG